MERSSDRDQLIKQVVAHGRRNSSGWVRVNCPFCETRGKTPDTKSSFAFNPATNGFVCNRCRTKGRVGGKVSVGTVKQVVATSWRSYIKGFDPMASPAVAQSQAAKPAYEYLANRGFTLRDIEVADIHIATGGKYAGRIVIPHKDTDESWWGFTARVYGPVQEGIPKVLYPPGMDRDKLYNEQALYEETERPVLVVEGVLDATWYLPDVVACLGKPTEAHLSKFLAAKRPIVFCLDGDAWEEGVAWARRCILRNKRDSFYVKLDAGEDPNSINPDWLWEQVHGVEVMRQLERMDDPF